MKQEQKMESGSCCNSCGTNGCCHQEWHGSKYALLRWLLGALILVVVFALGYKIGEFKSTFWANAGGYGNHMYLRSMPEGYDAMPMRGGMWESSRAVLPTSVPTPTPTPTKAK